MSDTKQSTKMSELIKKLHIISPQRSKHYLEDLHEKEFDAYCFVLGFVIQIADFQGWDWKVSPSANAVALVPRAQKGEPPYLARVEIPTEGEGTALERYILPRLECLVIALKGLEEGK